MTIVVTEPAMREIPLRDAKAKLSEVIDRALDGEPSVVTRHGKKTAVVVSYEDWTGRRSHVPSFGELLTSCPLEDGDWERDQTPPRDPGV